MNTQCQCLKCAKERYQNTSTYVLGLITVPIEMTQMFLCAICGNKRCPHSDNHENPCTNSNEPGQPGSRYA